jgi:hypothetical protein
MRRSGVSTIDIGCTTKNYLPSQRRSSDFRFPGAWTSHFEPIYNLCRPFPNIPRNLLNPLRRNQQMLKTTFRITTAPFFDLLS